MLDLAAELSEWLERPEVQAVLLEIMRAAVRAEISAALNEELLDVNAAATILGVTPAALRKAVERGQVACVRIGRRVRFRRAELLRATPAVDHVG